STASLSTTITSLHLDWTDFSSTAIDALLHMIPHLTHAFFGANHNRLPNANTMALKALKNNCRHIHSLKVALQQIHPTMISRLITYYGDQLIRLDIRCEDVTTLKAVAQHAKRIRQLNTGDTNRNAIQRIVQHCGRLTFMEMISWGIQDIPTVILEVM
ncbi:uncharacterized protein BX664DRAFT_235703, partial [Halteromyces radiatus]|uniref:uncharacterized protein n=1 Tax=Halteromyces radiatus TaxID=101107 RepID=UPI0022202947